MVEGLQESGVGCELNWGVNCKCRWVRNLSMGLLGCEASAEVEDKLGSTAGMIDKLGCECC